MEIIAFLCFASLIAGWLLAPSAAPTPEADPLAVSTAPETGTARA